MNYVTANGGNKGQRKLCEDVANFMIGKLMPRMRTLDIEINLQKLTGDVVGWCQMNDTNREFTLDISKDLTIKELVTTICHEMIHVWQAATRKMKDLPFGRKMYMGKVYDETTAYEDEPWEIEAYAMQGDLLKKFGEEYTV